MNVVVYSTTNCPYCKMLKGYLDEKSVSYSEKIIDQDGAAQEEMAKISGGFMGTPYTVITKEDGTQVRVEGFDKPKIDGALDLNS